MCGLRLPSWRACLGSRPDLDPAMGLSQLAPNFATDPLGRSLSWVGSRCSATRGVMRTRAAFSAFVTSPNARLLVRRPWAEQSSHGARHGSLGKGGTRWSSRGFYGPLNDANRNGWKLPRRPLSLTIYACQSSGTGRSRSAARHGTPPARQTRPEPQPLRLPCDQSSRPARR